MQEVLDQYPSKMDGDDLKDFINVLIKIDIENEFGSIDAYERHLLEKYGLDIITVKEGDMNE